MPLKSRLLPAIAGALLLSNCGTALAVPSFARQTGLECTNCHLSWPELTSVGRQFKLGGYTLIKETKGERPLLPIGDDAPPLIPLAGMLQGSVTHTQSTSSAGGGDFPRNDDFDGLLGSRDAASWNAGCAHTVSVGN